MNTIKVRINYILSVKLYKVLNQCTRIVGKIGALSIKMTQLRF